MFYADWCPHCQALSGTWFFAFLILGKLSVHTTTTIHMSGSERAIWCSTIIHKSLGLWTSRRSISFLPQEPKRWSIYQRNVLLTSWLSLLKNTVIWPRNRNFDESKSMLTSWWCHRHNSVSLGVMKRSLSQTQGGKKAKLSIDTPQHNFLVPFAHWEELAEKYPALKPYLVLSGQQPNLNWADPAATRELTIALLKEVSRPLY